MDSTYKCLKCNYLWRNREYRTDKLFLPNTCPRCKSKKWNYPRVICSVCNENKVSGKYGICKKCLNAYTRFYNLVKLQTKYQEMQYPEIIKARNLKQGIDLIHPENRFAKNHRKKILEIIGKKCYICQNSKKKVCIHHIK